MTVIIPDERIRSVKLTGDEIELLLETLEYQPHNMYLWFKNIIKQLKFAKNTNSEEVKKE